MGDEENNYSIYLNKFVRAICRNIVHPDEIEFFTGTVINVSKGEITIFTERDGNCTIKNEFVLKIKEVKNR